MKLKHMILALAVAIPGAVYANDCPNLLSEIDAALAANPQVNEETLTEIKDLREDGAKQHAAGEHDQSVESLTEALTLLGKR